MRLERRKKNRHVEVPTHALNDIMFFLLLFFLIISTMAAKLNSVKVTLPNSKTDRSAPKKNVELSVNENKEYFIGNEPVKYEDLVARINAELKDVPDADRVIAIRIDKNLNVQDLVDVLEILAENKIRAYLRTERMTR